MPRARIVIPNEEEVLREARQLKAEGVCWEQLCKRFNVTATWLRYRIEPGYKERRAKHNQSFKQSEYDARAIFDHAKNPPLTTEQLYERLALVPEDNRDLTARLMGDPIRPDPRREA